MFSQRLSQCEQSLSESQMITLYLVDTDAQQSSKTWDSFEASSNDTGEQDKQGCNSNPLSSRGAFLSLPPLSAGGNKLSAASIPRLLSPPAGPAAKSEMVLKKGERCSDKVRS